MTLGKLIQGLRLVEKYHGSGAYVLSAEHDQIYAGDFHLFDLTDRQEMLSLGWMEDENGSWSAWV